VDRVLLIAGLVMGGVIHTEQNVLNVEAADFFVAHIATERGNDEKNSIYWR
jgi:hypothetical protein